MIPTQFQIQQEREIQTLFIECELNIEQQLIIRHLVKQNQMKDGSFIHIPDIGIFIGQFGFELIHHYIVYLDLGEQFGWEVAEEIFLKLMNHIED